MIFLPGRRSQTPSCTSVSREENHYKFAEADLLEAGGFDRADGKPKHIAYAAKEATEPAERLCRVVRFCSKKINSFKSEM